MRSERSVSSAPAPCVPSRLLAYSTALVGVESTGMGTRGIAFWGSPAVERVVLVIPGGSISARVPAAVGTFAEL